MVAQLLRIRSTLGTAARPTVRLAPNKHDRETKPPSPGRIRRVAENSRPVGPVLAVLGRDHDSSNSWRELESDVLLQPR